MGTVRARDFPIVKEAKLAAKAQLAFFNQMLDATREPTPEITDAELEKFLPVAKSTGKPQVWLTRAEALQAIRAALKAQKG